MRTLLVLFVFGLGTGRAAAQELLPPPKESAPQPGPVVPQPAIAPPAMMPPPPVMLNPGALPPGLGFYRHSAYEHWQYLSTTPDGRWRPRILTTPAGPVWAYNGQPYYWYNSQPSWIHGVGTVPGR